MQQFFISISFTLQKEPQFLIKVKKKNINS